MPSVDAVYTLLSYLTWSIRWMNVLYAQGKYWTKMRCDVKICQAVWITVSQWAGLEMLHHGNWCFQVDSPPSVTAHPCLFMDMFTTDGWSEYLWPSCCFNLQGNLAPGIYVEASSQQVQNIHPLQIKVTAFMAFVPVHDNVLLRRLRCLKQCLVGFLGHLNTVFHKNILPQPKSMSFI